jgi:hypothetical protein
MLMSNKSDILLSHERADEITDCIGSHVCDVYHLRRMLPVVRIALRNTLGVAGVRICFRNQLVLIIQTFSGGR